METVLTIVFVFFPAVILHECAHGWVAYKLGDPTAKYLGRLTLNPIKHVDPMGTVLLPAMLILVRSPILFGWAKPVPVNFMNLRNPKRDMMWVGMAGPAINIALALGLSQLFHLGLSSKVSEVVATAVVINLVLAVFNLIPIPPLDGSRFVMSVLPIKYARMYSRLEPYGILIVFVLLYFGLLGRFVWPIVVAMAQSLGVPGDILGVY